MHVGVRPYDRPITIIVNDRIRHSGIVEDISAGCIKVRIVQSSSCVGCKISGHCTASEQKEKVIDVYTSDREVAPIQVGDEVMVSVSAQSGIEAVILAFGIPFVVLVATIFTVMMLTGNDAMSALSGLAVLIPYYAVLYALRSKITKRISFAIDTPFRTAGEPSSPHIA